ncbi:MAG: hypothetical protein EOO39_02665 [Cytophagaceae bacterium]|nr:MAG: hypothetical protein EOO39_02665 [Cytophagaceae bacterium]
MEGFAWNTRFPSDPDPDINNPDVEFFEKAYTGEPRSAAQQRLSNNAVTSRTRTQITNLQVYDNTGGGGGSPQIIAGNYAPGVSITPESGLDYAGTSWSSGTFILN